MCMKELKDTFLRDIGCLTRTIHAMLDDTYKAYGLQKNQFIFLTRVIEHPGINLIDLSNLLRVDKTTTTKAVQKLVEAGYLTKTQNTFDKRAMGLFPSEKGLEFYDFVIAQENQMIDLCNHSIDEADWVQLSNLVKKINQNLESEWLCLKHGHAAKKRKELQKMIRKATKQDLEAIMEILKESVDIMNQENNFQWDSAYPRRENFIDDIEKDSLYVTERDNKVAGFICINEIEPEEYATVTWSSQHPCMVAHRMAVRPNQRNTGVGTELMNYTEQLARDRGIYYLKTDTNSRNTKMNALFRKCGYTLAGEMSFRGRPEPFYCYEKHLRREGI